MIKYWLRRMFRRIVTETLNCADCQTPVVEVRAWERFTKPTLVIYTNATILCDACRGKRTARKVRALIALRDAASHGRKPS
jgi:hypothetical protein